jgi:hypothetical protein
MKRLNKSNIGSQAAGSKETFVGVCFFQVAKPASRLGAFLL